MLQNFSSRPLAGSIFYSNIHFVHPPVRDLPRTFLCDSKFLVRGPGLKADVRISPRTGLRPKEVRITVRGWSLTSVF